MTRLSGQTVSCEKSAAKVFQFLSDFSNFQKLLPPQVIDFTLEEEGCTFTIKGMATLGLAYESKIPNSEIVMVSKGKVPFAFKMTALIGEQGSGSTLCFVLDADLNPFLKMMAEKPLTNFLNLLAEKLGTSI